MLSQEQAQERLKAFRNPYFRYVQVWRVRALMGKLAFIGRILIRDGAVGYLFANRTRSESAYERAIRQLEELKPGERQRLFAALFPRLAPQVEATWRLFDHLPYQVGYGRRPFRTPRRRSSPARVAWLQALVYAVQNYDQDVTWFAAWAPYLGYGAADALGYLFAGAIEAGGSVGQAVFDILVASAEGRHETGRMGRHVVRGLLCASRPEGWAVIERLLLAAQREEGLRQVILESIDEAHPQAFRRLLHLILSHNLTRFSATVRASDVWLGLAFDAASQKTVNELLRRIQDYLDDPAARDQAFRHGPAQDGYLALWASAFEDAEAALPHVMALRRSESVEHRFAATHLLAQLALADGYPALLEALDDPDLRIAMRAVSDINPWLYRPKLIEESDLFERLERLIARLPGKETAAKPLVWDWFAVKLDRTAVTLKLLECLGERSPKRLIPYLSRMEPFARAQAASRLLELGKKDPETRQFLFTLAGDASSQVRETALRGLKGFRLTEAEVEQVEDLLARKAQDLRRGALQLILSLPDKAVLRSAERLLEKKNEQQRQAGLELLSECIQVKRRVPACRSLAEAFKNRQAPTGGEAQILEDILVQDVQQYSLKDALGLMNPKRRTKPRPPQGTGRWASLFRKVRLGSPAAVEILKSLDALVEQHRAEPVELASSAGRQTQLLGNLRVELPEPEPDGVAEGRPAESDLAWASLGEVWEAWWQARQARQAAWRDPDGWELLRAAAVLELFSVRYVYNGPMEFEIPDDLQKAFDVRCNFKLHYQPQVASALKWLIRAHPVPGETAFLLDALEVSVSRIPYVEMAGVRPSWGYANHSILPTYLAYLDLCRWHRRIRPDAWTDEHHTRLWAVVLWLDRSRPWVFRQFRIMEDALLAQRSGGATQDDLLDMLLGRRDNEDHARSFTFLGQLSGRKPHPLFTRYPALKTLVESCRERILSIELRRGDLPTAASAPALALRSAPGMENLFRLLAGLGKASFERGFSHSLSRAAVLSHLVRVSYPADEDSPEDFAELARCAGLTERRLVELAAYAPQWAGFVEHTLGWPKLGEAVFWVYAHTKDRQWNVEVEIRALWAAQVSEYTPLSADSLMDGAVDVGWFHQVYGVLGEKHWDEVYRAASLTASGSGHVRARLYADAMLGRVTADELMGRILQKRNQDALRSLGLCPLPGGSARQAETLRRYEVMQEFLRSSKKFGSQRQASEKLAVAIGLENLARTAGYSDPQRLEWAMEVAAVADLAAGPVEVRVEETCIRLAIDSLGEPELSVTKNGRRLKLIPAALKKEPQIAGLVERKTKLNRQTGRMRLSLESAMCRGDLFSGEELGGLFCHPVLRRMLEQLIFVRVQREAGADGMGGPQDMGYPVVGAGGPGDGLYLVTHSGEQTRVGPADRLRIAHPVDLLASGEWHRWQHECFVAERIQPFKQVFRELYVLTEAEKAEGNLSRRYAGQQVNPGQAFALFGARGWVAAPEEGVHKTFHDLGISARVAFLQAAFTPVEIEGLTLEGVVFTPRGAWQPLALEEIPPRMFSEVMRDLDLVVSVAHAGGVDPEASLSSIEARSALVLETCSLLGLKNVAVKYNHVLVSGKLGNYTIYLGSGVVHKQPGGALCIVPVHAQQRGRLFLPFVDNDPKTAEVVSKVILLAKDHEIKDPTILEQILK